MATTAEKFVNEELAEFARNPKGGSKYFEALDGYASNEAHCCEGQSYVFTKLCGEDVHGHNTVTLRSAILAAGGKIVANKWSDEARYGDILLMHWDDSTDLHSVLNHACVFERVAGADAIQTLDFNGNSARENKRFLRYKRHVAYIVRFPFVSSENAKKEGYTGWAWDKAHEKCYHYTNGKLDKDAWFKGTGGWSKHWFYVGSDGAAITDSWFKYKGKYYHFNGNGMCEYDTWAKGSGKYAGKWYYLGSDGVPVKNTWVKGANGRDWYYLGPDCAMVTDSIVEYGGKRYYLDKDGRASAR